MTILYGVGAILSRLSILYWILPYIIGTFCHHLISRHWIRTAGWAIGLALWSCVFISYFMGVVMWSGAIDALNMRWLLASCIVMIGQVVFWGWLWYRLRRRGSISGWRTIATFALPVSLVFCLTTTICYAGWAGFQHQQLGIAEDRLAGIGYEPYPGAEYPLDSYPYSPPRFRDGRKLAEASLTIWPKTQDDPEQVVDFYLELFENEGFEVRRGLLRSAAERTPRPDRRGGMHVPDESSLSPGRPALLAIRDDRVAVLVHEGITVFWNTHDDFREQFDLYYEWVK